MEIVGKDKIADWFIRALKGLLRAITLWTDLKQQEEIRKNELRKNELKHKLLDWVSPDDIEGDTKFDIAVLQNLKPHEAGKSVDYPDVVKEMGHYFDKDNYGILVCGSGYGVSIAANRFKNISILTYMKLINPIATPSLTRNLKYLNLFW